MAYLSVDDQCRCHLDESLVVVTLLLMPHMESTKAVEPAMRDFHDPSPGSLRRMPPLLFGFLSPAFDVGNIVMLLDDGKSWLAAIAGIGTQVLAAPGSRGLALDHDGLLHLVELGDIMLIGSGHDERQRDATAVHQQVSLAPLFFPDPSGCVPPPLAPTAP